MLRAPVVTDVRIALRVILHLQVPLAVLFATKVTMQRRLVLQAVPRVLLGTRRQPQEAQGAARVLLGATVYQDLLRALSVPLSPMLPRVVRVVLDVLTGRTQTLELQSVLTSSSGST